MANETLILGNNNWAVKADNLLGYAVGETSGDYVPREFTFSRNSTATYTDENGIIQTASANIARIQDNALLLEPQRTNLLQYSEAISTSPWGLTRSTVTTNNINSPSGTETGDELIANITDSNGSWTRQIVSAITGAFSISIYAKQGTSPFLQIRLDGLGGVIFDLSNGTIKASSVVVGSIVSIGSDGWYRCTISGTATGQTVILFLVGNSSMTLATWFATLGDSVYLWGAQLEQGAYATTYIPTTTAAVTRVADSAVKTGISSLIGQTEGTVFIDVDLNSRGGNTYFAIAPNILATGAYIGIAIQPTRIGFEVVNSGTQANIINFSSATGRFKIAAGYKENDFVLYVNGVQIGTDNSGTVPACSQLGFLAYSQTQTMIYNSAILFPTRLTNAELQAITHNIKL